MVSVVVWMYSWGQNTGQLVRWQQWGWCSWSTWGCGEELNCCFKDSFLLWRREKTLRYVDFKPSTETWTRRRLNKVISHKFTYNQTSFWNQCSHHHSPPLRPEGPVHIVLSRWFWITAAERFRTQNQTLDTFMSCWRIGLYHPVWSGPDPHPQPRTTADSWAGV